MEDFDAIVKLLDNLTLVGFLCYAWWKERQERLFLQSKLIERCEAKDKDGAQGNDE